MGHGWRGWAGSHVDAPLAPKGLSGKMKTGRWQPAQATS
jgi:hypothetical protein